MIKGLDHIAIAVHDLDAAAKLWQTAANAEVVHREVVPEQSVELLLLRIGTLRIELMCPITETSSVAKFLRTRGEGLHHIALECESADEELLRSHANGVKLIDEHARTGAEGSHVGFVHPRSLGGVLLEFVDHRK
jgi:methylmalonyl-CoA/ethylmalonyl-CoA epimerase